MTSNRRLPRSLRKKLHTKVKPYLKIRIIAVLAACIIAVGVGSSYAIMGTVSRDLPTVTSLKNYKPPMGTQIFSEDDHLIGRIKIDKGIFVHLSQMPDSMKKAIVAVEDARFYEHKGIDYQGIVRAVLKDILSVSLKEGGSTITQQLAKVLFLTPEKSFSRKIKEAMLAKKIEEELTKDEILELYLNKVYFGHGAYGVEMASRTYFGKRVGDLNLGESALIAGLVKSPLNYSPYNNMELARNREQTVLGRMVDEKFITRGEAKKAFEQGLTLKNLRINEEVAPHLVEQIRIYVEGKYGLDKVYKEGLIVHTTIDYRQQQAANRAVEYGLRALDKRQGWRGPLSHKEPREMKKLLDDPPARADLFSSGETLTATVLSAGKDRATISVRGGKAFIPLKDMIWAGGKDAAKKKASNILKPGDVVEVGVRGLDKKAKLVSFALEQEPLAQAALVAIDPWEGKVKAMVGGYDFQKNEYNHAESARRQPGSSFKPFVYAAAMEAGFTPASIIDDTRRSYDDDTWKPANYDGEYNGPTRLREALVFSRNVVTIDLLHQLGVGSVIDLATKLGITGPYTKDLTLALGSCSVSPMEITAAYSAFANGGYRVKPITVTSITDSKGGVLESNSVDVEQVMSPESAYQVTCMLEDATVRGTAKGASSLGRPLAGKTGTTNDYKDAWFVGYTPDLIAGVWVGYDDHKTLGHKEAGARAAMPIWMRFMGSAFAEYPPDDFKVPDGIEFVDIDAATGLLADGKGADVVHECFKKGSGPKESAKTSPAPASAKPDLSIPDKLMPGIKDKQKLLEESD